MNSENMQVINALVGKPVRWDGNVPDAKDPETEAVAALLAKRRDGAAPSVIAKLLGVDRREVNKHLLRLKRAGRAVDVAHGLWVAA